MEESKRAQDGQGACEPVPPLKLVLQPSGMAVELNRPETVVGRHMSADLRLPLPDVSRQHCRFVYADGCWQVYDLNSLNGVYVNQQRVPHALLHHGDLVRVGGFTFQVELPTMERTIPLPSSSERVLRSIAQVLETQSVPAPQTRQAS